MRDQAQEIGLKRAEEDLVLGAQARGRLVADGFEEIADRGRVTGVAGVTYMTAACRLSCLSCLSCLE